MSKKLTGKVAIVTGASKGIGAGIAKAFGAEGASVVVNYATSKEGADKVVAEITKNGGKAVAVQADVGNAADVKRLFAEAKKAFGQVDVVMNTAGVYSFGPMESFSEAEFHRQFNANVLGTMLMTRESLDYFGKEGGSIINTSSISSTNPVPNSTVYSSSKAAIDTFTVALARELGARKIRVNAIAPGVTMSEGLESLGITGGSDFEKHMTAQTPLGRLGQPADIAKVAVFLASDDAAWVTGVRVAASGGL